MSIRNLFHSDPTRQLEEVQKVNARERAETDVSNSTRRRVQSVSSPELGDVIETHPGEAARFLYLHATFGSGKTHLLKLIGLVADTESEFAHLGTELAEQWPGFDNLAQSIESSHVERLKPVFLNLLDQDASKEPPLPFLIFEAIGRELGYPTDPNWLLEWAWTVDMGTRGSGMRSRPPSTTGKRSRTCSKSVLRCGGGSTKHSQHCRRRQGPSLTVVTA